MYAFRAMADVLPSEELVEEPSDYGALQPGTRLGRYEMLVPIARGGMARVWAARLHGQRGFQKLVAIKVILPHLAEEPEFERMFLDEARIASGVHHPNVCEIYELGEEKKTLYLVMEWVSGDSLARVLRSTGKTEAVDPRVVARVVADACAGVHAAHELTDDDGRALGVVHRDLSPHNILISAAGIAKVCDFGVAKALGQLHEATSAGQLKGKIAYMAPEQITGAPVDRRSDVFSLGCVLYEATTGMRPFRGDGDHQVMHSVLKGEAPPPTSILRGYPQELERIVLRALSPQPILRFPTAERMRFALEEFLARGQLVTQSNVAQVLRARIGDLIDRRKERIRQASSAGDGEAGWSEPPGNMTPSNQAHDGGHRSGVKAASSLGPQSGRPMFSTMQMDRPQAAAALGRLATGGSVPPPGLPHPNQPSSSTTIPQAPPFPQHQGAPGHTPISHPGAAYPSAPPQPRGASNHPPPPPQFQARPPLSMPPPFAAPPTSTMPPSAVPGSFPPPGGPFGGAQPFELPGGEPEAPPSSAPAGAGQYAIAIGIGVLVAALIGVGGFLLWQRSAAPPEAPTTATAPRTSATGSAVAPATADITFRLTPAEATLSVEGQELPGSVRTVPRPGIGKTVNVVARAKGYEDTTILVDFFTASSMDLKLKRAEGAGPQAPPTQAPPSPEALKDLPKDPPREPPKDPPRKGAPRQPKDPGVPPNPF